MPEDGPRLGLAIVRALRRRCPRCGARIFEGYLRIEPVCPGCRLLTDRGEEDYFVGAMLVNLIAAEMVPVLTLLAIILITFPAVPWTATLWITAGLAVAMPVIFYPFSKTLWLAVDLALRSPVDQDDAGPGAE